MPASTTSPRRRQVRAQKAALTRWGYKPTDPEVVDADRNLAESRIEDYVRKILAEAPPLRSEQRTRLAELLKPVRRRGNAVASAGGSDAA
jgi:hypothetical protein